MPDAEKINDFVNRIASEDFLPLPSGLSDDDWGRPEVQEDMQRRVRGGTAAEILFRAFEWYQYECAGSPTYPVSCSPGIPQWSLFSDEPLWIPHDQAVLFWEKDVGARNMDGQRFFARRLSRAECKRFIKLVGRDRLR